jgi:hypothetical protein
MTTVLVPVEHTDAAIVGASMRSQVELGRCGPAESAQRYARVGQALAVAAAGAVQEEDDSMVTSDRDRIAVHAAKIAGTLPLTAAALFRLLNGEVG